MTVRSLLATAQRREAWLWLLLAVAVAAAGHLAQGLRLEFGFKDVLSAENPVRREFEVFADEFELRPRITAYFEGPGVFSAAFLEAMEATCTTLERTPGILDTASALDLFEPVNQGDRVRMTRILRPEVVSDPARLAEVLSRPPFTDRWHGLLYDRGLTVFALDVTFTEDDPDFARRTRLMEAIVAELDRLAAVTGTRYVVNGIAWLNHELLRVTFENQARLTLLGLAAVLLTIWALFANFRFALASLGMLAVAVHLAFGAMALCDLPVNGMSGNLPLLVIVIGLSDIVHLAAAYADERRRHRIRAASLRAATETAFANALTAVASLGCTLVSAFTELQVLHDFSLAISLGIVSAWLVTIVFGPLLLIRTDLRPDHGLFGRLHVRIASALSGWLKHAIEHRATVPVGLGMILAMGAFAATLRIDSNWYLLFTPGLPVARTREFLLRTGFPASGIDCRIRSTMPLDQALADPAVRRDLARLEAELAKEPGVTGVFTLGTLAAMVDDGFARLDLPADLAPHWRAARHASLRRDLLASGALDQYFGLSSRHLRIQVAASYENASGLLDLAARLTARARALRLEALDPARFEVSGQMLYWGAIMDYVATTFTTSAAGALLVVLTVFVVVSGSLRLGLLAMLPNLPAPLSMFVVAHLLGWEMNENFIFILDLSFGIAVDDTLHFLFHERRHREHGEDAGAATMEALGEIGAPIVVATLILVAGFSVCLAGSLRPTVQSGVYLGTALLVAMVAELLLAPALLRRRPAETGQSVAPPPDSPRG